MNLRFGIVVAAWGGLLAVVAAVALGFDSDVRSPALLGGAAAFALLGALALLFTRADRGSEIEREAAISPPTVWLAVALALTAVGAVLGPWLVLIGAGMTLIGIGGLVREMRSQRRSTIAAGRQRR